MSRYFPVVAIVAVMVGLILTNARPAAHAQDGGSISGIVYLDKDMDGERDLGEGPLSGRAVQLVSENGAPLSDFVKSGADGSYRFTNLSPDINYGVSMLRDADTPCIEGSIYYFFGNEANTVDLGALTPGSGSLSGTLISDLDENGVKDSNEPPLGGWQLRVNGTLGSIECEVPNTTDGSGRFRFDGLYPGMYGLTVASPAADLKDKVSWQVTFIDHPASAPGAYPESRPDPSLTLSGSSRAEGLVIGVHVLSGSGSVTAWIFNDSNLNGEVDAGEDPFDCCGIMLLRSTPVGFVLVQPYEPRIDAGHYEWIGLPASDYKVALMTWRPGPTAPTEEDGRPVRTFSLQEGEKGVAEFGFGPLPPESDEETPPTVEPTPAAQVLPPNAGDAEGGEGAPPYVEVGIVILAVFGIVGLAAAARTLMSRREL